MNEHFTTLGLPVTATADEVKKAFHKLAHLHHPDKGGDAETFKKISNAYSTLKKHLESNPQQMTGDSITVTYTQGNVQWTATHFGFTTWYE